MFGGGHTCVHSRHLQHASTSNVLTFLYMGTCVHSRHLQHASTSNVLTFLGWPEPYIYGVYTVFLAGKSPYIRCIYTVLANPAHFCKWVHVCGYGASTASTARLLLHLHFSGGGCMCVAIRRLQLLRHVCLYIRTSLEVGACVWLWCIYGPHGDYNSTYAHFGGGCMCANIMHLRRLRRFCFYICTSLEVSSMCAAMMHSVCIYIYVCISLEAGAGLHL
jgi:hypothetical protein